MTTPQFLNEDAEVLQKFMTSKAARRVERLYKKFIAIEEKIKSVKEIECRLDELRQEMHHTEQQLFDLQMLVLREIKSISIHLLKMIQGNVPNAPILEEFAFLLAEEGKWLKGEGKPFERH